MVHRFIFSKIVAIVMLMLLPSCAIHVQRQFTRNNGNLTFSDSCVHIALKDFQSKVIFYPPFRSSEIDVEDKGDYVLVSFFLYDKKDEEVYANPYRSCDSLDSSFPTQYVTVGTHLYYWHSDGFPFSNDVYEQLMQHHRIDTTGLPTIVLKECKIPVYYFCKENQRNFKYKRVYNAELDMPELNCSKSRKR